MNRIKLISSLVFGLFLIAPLSAQDEVDKIGTVSIQKLTQEYYKTRQVLKVYKEHEKTVIAQNETRLEKIKKLILETRELKAEAENSTLPREKQEVLFRKILSQQREFKALQNEQVTWLNRKRAAFSEAQNADLGKLRQEILVIVREVGEAENYDFIFDRSGASGANVLILAYAKDATDLTPVLLERINKDAPEETEDPEKAPEEEGKPE